MRGVFAGVLDNYNDRAAGIDRPAQIGKGKVVMQRPGLWVESRVDG